jgi:hypothetical protein
MSAALAAWDADRGPAEALVVDHPEVDRLGRGALSRPTSCSAIPKMAAAVR